MRDVGPDTPRDELSQNSFLPISLSSPKMFSRLSAGAFRKAASGAARQQPFAGARAQSVRQYSNFPLFSSSNTSRQARFASSNASASAFEVRYPFPPQKSVYLIPSSPSPTPVQLLLQPRSSPPVPSPGTPPSMEPFRSSAKSTPATSATRVSTPLHTPGPTRVSSTPSTMPGEPRPPPRPPLFRF